MAHHCGMGRCRAGKGGPASTPSPPSNAPRLPTSLLLRRRPRPPPKLDGALGHRRHDSLLLRLPPRRRGRRSLPRRRPTASIVPLWQCDGLPPWLWRCGVLGDAVLAARRWTQAGARSALLLGIGPFYCGCFLFHCSGVTLQHFFAGQTALHHPAVLAPEPLS